MTALAAPPVPPEGPLLITEGTSDELGRTTEEPELLATGEKRLAASACNKNERIILTETSGSDAKIGKIGKSPILKIHCVL